MVIIRKIVFPVFVRYPSIFLRQGAEYIIPPDPAKTETLVRIFSVVMNMGLLKPREYISGPGLVQDIMHQRIAQKSKVKSCKYGKVIIPHISQE